MSTLPLRAVGPSTSLLHCIGIYLCNLSQHLVCVHESPRARVLAAVIGCCGRSQHGNMFPIIAHRKGLGPLVGPPSLISWELNSLVYPQNDAHPHSTRERESPSLLFSLWCPGLEASHLFCPFFPFFFPFLFWQDHRISEWVNGYRGDQTCDHVHVHGHDQCRCSASRQQARPSKSHQILEARIRNAILLGCPRYLMSRLTARCTIFTSGKT